MKRALLNGRWDFWVPDNVANWDAITSWERERLASMEEHLKPGMILYDIGAEHGWLSAIYGTFVDHENMVLVEPSPFFWPNIRRVWEMNGFKLPLATWCAYAGAKNEGEIDAGYPWPARSDGPECDAQAYVSLAFENGHGLPTLTIDWISCIRPSPGAVTIDVEGAELLVLQGSEYVLRIDRPLVWVSIHEDLMVRDYHTDAEDLYHYMGDLDYANEFIARDHETHVLFTPRERI